MESYYEILVVFNGRHLFATAPRSCRTRNDLERVWNHMVAAFPAKDGYSLSVTHWEGQGSSVEGYENPWAYHNESEG